MSHTIDRTEDCIRLARLRNFMRPSRPTQRSLPHIADFSLGEDVDLVIGLTAAALAGNEVARLAKSHQHQGSHLFKAGLSAAVAASALKLMQREHQDHHEHRNGHSREHTRHHHSRGMLEENGGYQHENDGSSTHYNYVQHACNNERHSDHSERNLENHTHRHRRHSLDSTLPVEHDNHNYYNPPNSTHTSAPSQTHGHGYTIPRSHASPEDTTTLARLTARDNGHHHVHFSDDYDQDSSRSSR